MKLKILGVGIWARGLRGFEDLIGAVHDNTWSLADKEFIAPKPEAIPTRERRRAGLMINLAVQTAHQACDHAGVDKSQIPSVFASAVGDTDITDYMCRKLASPEKLLSPTKFHNSVHNAPAGYWSISANNRAPSTFVGAFRESFAAGLLEATSQAVSSGGPVLLVAYDIANKPPFSNLIGVTESLACGLVVVPHEPFVAQGCSLNVDALVRLENGNAQPLCLPRAPALAALAESNPVGCALGLFEQLALIHSGVTTQATVKLAVGLGTTLTVALGTPA